MIQYAIPIFLGAFLLFQVQPVIARCILPWFGGTPAVWTTCMLFFQVLLLGGYAYAHALVSRLHPRGQALAQDALLAVSVGLMVYLMRHWGVPIIPDASWKPTGSNWPVPHILMLLSVSVGLPYLVLATTSPLLQAWFSRTRPGVSPYRLYTLSNIGSLLALLSYPVLVEPTLTMRAQGMVWSAGYLVFVLGYAVCAWGAAQKAEPIISPEETLAGPAPSPARTTRLMWVVLPALASAFLLAVTNQICQEVAVIPFLWVLPLSIYLLSFIICFDSPRWYSRQAYLPALLLILPLVGYTIMQQDHASVKIQVLVYASALFLACMFCHGELVSRRPHPRYLTGFYLAVSVGGALGGLFVALLAPLLFKRFYELHVCVLALWVLAVLTVQRRRILGKPMLVFLTLFTFVQPTIMIVRSHDASGRLLSVRNFYGSFRVDDDYSGKPWHQHTLVNGATIHGIQYWNQDKRRQPLSYYSLNSGVGLSILRHPRRVCEPDHSLRIGVVGLGTGTIAAYANSGDYVYFYDINPAIERMARDPRYFTYLSDCPAQVEVTLGDARLSLERELKETGSQRFDILVLDAFSSDAIPAHLLTREAFAIYLAHLRQPDGIIAVHVSNRALDLRRVAWTLADYYHLETVQIVNESDSAVYNSDWILVTSSKRFMRDAQIVRATIARPQTEPLRLWTDDYYNLFQILR